MARPVSKVLVVDDVELNRLVLCRVLKRLGFHALECCTGAEALQAFMRHSSQIACILMDINMPEMDGLEATFRIRQEEERSASTRVQESCDSGDKDPLISSKNTQQKPVVPIWAISACCDDEQWHSPVLAHLSDDQQKGPLWKRAGMDDFLSKPVNISELLDKLKALDKSSDYADSSAQSLSMQKKEFWEDKGIKRRCSLEDAASPFTRKARKSGMQQSGLLLTSELAE